MENENSQVELGQSIMQGLQVRVRLYELLSFVRSRQQRDRVAGLSFGDMIQSAIEAIDSDEGNKNVAANPLDLQTPGALQGLDRLEQMSEETFKAAEALLDTSSESLYDTDAYQEILEGEFGDEFEGLEKALAEE